MKLFRYLEHNDDQITLIDEEGNQKSWEMRVVRVREDPNNLMTYITLGEQPELWDMGVEQSIALGWPHGTRSMTGVEDAKRFMIERLKRQEGIWFKR